MKTSVDRKKPGQLTGERSTRPRGLLRKQIRRFHLESFSPKRENSVKIPGVAISGIPPKDPCQCVPRPGLTIAPPGKVRRFSELCPRSGRGGWNNSLAAFSPNNGPCRFLNERREIRPDAIGDAKHQFHRGIPQAPLDQAEHGFGYARTLGDGVIREFSPLAFRSQEPNYLFSDGFIMSDSRHAVIWQKIPLDIYIAIVKYRAIVKLMKRSVFQNKPYLALASTIFTKSEHDKH